MIRTIYYCALVALFGIAACVSETSKKQSTGNTVLDRARFGCRVPEVNDKSWYTSGKKAPIFNGLEGMHYSISTKSKEAQQYFDQGLMLAFGFNHAEAARSFYESARIDSNCAMGWWGYAYVLGPNYNGGMEKDNFQRAYDAIQKAQSKSVSCTQIEKDLIAALSVRYSNDTNVARSRLDSNYTVAMRSLFEKYPNDVTVGAMFAESIMDLHPWNLWKKDGQMQPWTAEIVNVLESCLKRDANHVGANHFYIHAMEMSQHAETSLPSANLLRSLVPGSGHLLHMPSHTDIRIGHYHEGLIANQKAVLVDSFYVVTCHAQGVYPLAYFPHNFHFIAACGTLDGESKLAMTGANETALHALKQLFRDPAWASLQHYYTIPWYVEVKLGLWNNILQSPAPDSDLKYPSVIWHYAQGMAKLSLHKVDDARKVLVDIKSIMKDTTVKQLTIWGINNVYDLCQIASNILEGEIFAKEKKYKDAIGLLSMAVAKEDALNYDEPPDWVFSVRHHLGAVLIEAGEYNLAIKVYLDDLKTYRENGWALRGLMNAYDKLGNRKMYDEAKRRFDEAWKYADIEISSSRIL